MKKPTKTKLRIIQHTLKPDMIQAFAVLMYSSLSSYFKKTSSIHHTTFSDTSMIAMI